MLKKVLEKIRLSLRTGGIFAATFWGDKDIRNKDKNLCMECTLKLHRELYFKTLKEDYDKSIRKEEEIVSAAMDWLTVNGYKLP